MERVKIMTSVQEGNERMLDLAIIGSGPAALGAALYAARAGLQVTVFERNAIGGVLPQIPRLANYPGFQGSGAELGEAMRSQALSAGARIEYGSVATVQRAAAYGFTLTVDDGTQPVAARAVLVATGSEPRTLTFDLSVPVSYCALCDADLAKGQRVAVVGGANSAVQEALYLAPLVRELVLITHSQLKADACLVEKLRAQSNITVRENVEPSPELLNDFDRVFVFIGKRPATSAVQGLATEGSAAGDSAAGVAAADLFDEQGYLRTGQGVGASSHVTILPGLFAAGDVRSGAVRQVVTAAADGAAAALEIAQYLKENA